MCRGVTASEAILEGKKCGRDEEEEEWQEYHHSWTWRQEKDEVYDGGTVVSSSSDDDNSGLASLTGEDLLSQLRTWSEYGCIEPPSSATSSTQIATLDDTSLLIQDKVFVLLGTTSELDPYKIIAELGATIVAVARKGKKLQPFLEAAGERKKNEGGGIAVTIIVPVRRDCPQPPSSTLTYVTEMEDTEASCEEAAGADLIEDAPELVGSIASLYPAKRLVICNLAYVDSEKTMFLGGYGSDIAMRLFGTSSFEQLY